MSNKSKSLSFEEWRIECKKIKTSNYHVSMDGETETVTIRLIAK